jgi:hypothetical protein
VAYVSRFGDRIVCACGVIALADHELGGWRGDAEHFMSFIPTPPSQDEDQQPLDESFQMPRSETVAQIMADLGIDPSTLAEEPVEDSSRPPRMPQDDRSAWEAPDDTSEDPFGAKAERERAEKDARNARDRARRLKKRQAAERRHPGRKFPGFRPRGG